MGDPLTSTVWVYRSAFFGLSLTVMILGLVPLSLAEATVAPDILLALALAFVVRRPDFAPFALICAVFLLADIIRMQPLGLYTLIVVIASEYLRHQTSRFREARFWVEWVLVGGLIVAVMMTNRLVLSMMLVPQAGFGTTFLHLVLTVAIYPAVAFFCAYILRIRKLTQRQAERLGYSL